MKKERIIYVLLLVIAGAGLVNLLRDEADMLPFENKRYWILKTHSEKKFPVVFGGDSRIYRGISPDDFAAEFKSESSENQGRSMPDMSGVNLGYSANGYHPEYMDFLEKRLDMKAEQPVIVLGISAHPFSRIGMKARNYFWEKNGRKKEEIIQYMHFYRLNKLFAPFDIMDLLYGVRQKKSQSNLQLTYHFNGWMESHELKPDTTFYNRRYNNAFTNNLYDSLGTEGFFKRVSEWTGKGITVVGFRTPVSHTLTHLEDSLSGFSVPEFRQQFEAHGGKWVEVDRSKYLTYDGNHLEHESAIRFSRDLAKSVQQFLSKNPHTPSQE